MPLLDVSLVDGVTTAHALSLALMTGVIWVIQVVHYPLFATVPPTARREYFKRHVYRISLLVMPLMLIELATAVALVVLAYGHEVVTYAVFYAWLNLGLLVGTWLSTFLIQVPHHNRLKSNPGDDATIHALVRWNWLRTMLWSARLVLFVLVCQVE